MLYEAREKRIIAEEPFTPDYSDLKPMISVIPINEGHMREKGKMWG